MMNVTINDLNVIAVEDDGSKENCSKCIFNSYCYDGFCPVVLCERYTDIKYHFVHHNRHLDYELSNGENMK